MNFYRIYSKNNNELIEITYERFSIIIGILNFLWLIFRGHWPVLILYIIFIFLSNISPDISAVSSYIIIFLFAIFPSEIEDFSLKIRGFELKDIIIASSKSEAEYKYFKSKAQKN